MMNAMFATNDFQLSLEFFYGRVLFEMEATWTIWANLRKSHITQLHMIFQLRKILAKCNYIPISSLI